MRRTLDLAPGRQVTVDVTETTDAVYVAMTGSPPETAADTGYRPDDAPQQELVR
jgi:hypothetical protein